MRNEPEPYVSPRDAEEVRRLLASRDTKLEVSVDEAEIVEALVGPSALKSDRPRGRKELADFVLAFMRIAAPSIVPLGS